MSKVEYSKRRGRARKASCRRPSVQFFHRGVKETAPQFPTLNPTPFVLGKKSSKLGDFPNYNFWHERCSYTFRMDTSTRSRSFHPVRVGTTSRCRDRIGGVATSTAASLPGPLSILKQRVRAAFQHAAIRNGSRRGGWPSRSPKKFFKIVRKDMTLAYRNPS